MADASTTNYALTKPEIGASADTWGAKLSTNFDTIDATLKSVSDVAAAALPKAGGTMTGAIGGVSAIRTSGGVTGSVSPSTPTTIITALSLNGGTSADGYIVFGGVGGPGAGYAIAVDINGSFMLLAQGSAGSGSGITFSVSGPYLQISHSYGAPTFMAWQAVRIGTV